MKAKTVLGMLCASTLLSTGPTTPAFAQEAFMHYEPWIHTGIPPRKAGTAETCPAIMWDIERRPGEQKGTYTLRGPVWNEDGTGMSMATGELRPDRTFTFDVKSVMGKGLTGTVTGVLGRDGSRDLKMTGPGACDNIELHLKPGQVSAKKR